GAAREGADVLELGAAPAAADLRHRDDLVAVAPRPRAVGRDPGRADRARLRRPADHARVRELPRPGTAGDVRVRAVDVGLRPPGPHLARALRPREHPRLRVRAEPRLARVHLGRVLPGRAVRLRLPPAPELAPAAARVLV